MEEKKSSDWLRKAGTLSKLLGHTFVRDFTRVWDPGEEKYII